MKKEYVKNNSTKTKEVGKDKNRKYGKTLFIMNKPLINKVNWADSIQ